MTTLKQPLVPPELSLIWPSRSPGGLFVEMTEVWTLGAVVLRPAPVPKARAWPFLRPSWPFFRCSQRVQIIASQVVFSEYGAAFGGEIASLRAGREVGRRRVTRQGSVQRFVATVLPFQSASLLQRSGMSARELDPQPRKLILRRTSSARRSTLCPDSFPEGATRLVRAEIFVEHNSHRVRSVALPTRRYLPRRLFSPRPVSTIQPFSPSKFSRKSSPSGPGDLSTDLPTEVCWSCSGPPAGNVSTRAR